VSSASEKDVRPFCSLKSYVDPNAICPVCGDVVFFYQSPNGGRVFFDDLGWPWPKHPCTDNDKAVAIANTKTPPGKIYSFRTKSGNRLDLYDLKGVTEVADSYEFVFTRQDNKRTRIGYLRISTLKKAGVQLEDFYQAPSFVFDQDESKGDKLQVYFICVRLKQVLPVKMRKTNERSGSS